jgi:hypothetical protein
MCCCVCTSSSDQATLIWHVLSTDEWTVSATNHIDQWCGYILRTYCYVWATTQHYTEFILRTPSNSALYMYMYIGQAYTDRNHHTSISWWLNTCTTINGHAVTTCCHSSNMMLLQIEVHVQRHDLSSCTEYEQLCSLRIDTNHMYECTGELTTNAISSASPVIEPCMKASLQHHSTPSIWL